MENVVDGHAKGGGLAAGMRSLLRKIKKGLRRLADFRMETCYCRLPLRHKQLISLSNSSIAVCSHGTFAEDQGPTLRTAENKYFFVFA